jgi:large subunit ribosomal protein L10
MIDNPIIANASGFFAENGKEVDNALKLEEKRQIAEDLHERFLKSVVVIVTDFKGLDVTAITELRRKLKEEQTEYQVVKNTLLVRAAKDTDVELIRDVFKGPSAIAVGYQNPVTPAKVLTQFAKANEKLEIRAGVMRGRVLDLDAIKALANLPSREQLLAKLLGTMNEVPTAFVRVLSETPRRLLNVLQAVKDQKEAA